MKSRSSRSPILPRLKLDEAAWTDRIARASGLYKDDPQAKTGDGAAQYSNAQFQGRVTNTWLVSSEGAIVRKSTQQYLEALCRRHAGA